MSEAVLAIQDQIRAILKVDPHLADIVAFYRGVPNEVPTAFYPFAVIVVTGDDEATRLTGDLTVTAYSGAISINVRGRDVPEPVDREADIDSYTDVVTLVSAIKRLFTKPENRTLQELTDPDGQWAVVEMFIADGGGVVYGYATPDERTNNYENYGIIPFIVTVQEASET